MTSHEKSDDVALAGGDDALAALRRRNLYITQRLQALHEEIAGLRSEQKAIGTRLREEGVAKTPEAQALRKRRLYVVERAREASEEMKKLKGERKDALAKLRA